MKFKVSRKIFEKLLENLDNPLKTEENDGNKNDEKNKKSKKRKKDDGKNENLSAEIQFPGRKIKLKN